MRTPLTLAALALTALAAHPVGPALSAEPLTCQGQAVTIGDTDGGAVQGTDGDDVISASGPDLVVSARGGDDTVCVTDGVVRAGPGHDSVQVAGEVEGERLSIGDAEDLDIALGDGGGTIELDGLRRGEGTIDTGEDTAVLRVLTTHRVALDLADDLMEVDGGGSYAVAGSPAFYASARKVYLEGDEQPNVLVVDQHACRVTVEGGAGDDNLRLAPGGHADRDCWHTPSQLVGEAGDDVLQGRRYGDVLLGGAGADLARGGLGRDACRAETEVSCER